MTRPTRVDGYAPIRDYAILGDGGTAALIALDGAVDWLCSPDFNSGSVFGALLDPQVGGSFRISPAADFEAERRYLDGTNVLETTFRTSQGTVRLTDAMLLAGKDLAPMRELARKVECLEGRATLDVLWEPRFHYATAPTRIGRTLGRPVAHSRADAAALSTFGCRLDEDRGGARGQVRLEAGESALLNMSFSCKEPLVLPGEDDTRKRLDATTAFWQSWTSRAEYDGRWREAVLRSALCLKLLVFSPSGAILSAPTTSLPEEIGGVRNWDYRFTWLRDASWALDALLRLGYDEEAHAFLWWFMHASRMTHPRLHVLYAINGATHTQEGSLDLAGYHGSRPVRTGNGASSQLQLDVYGEVLQSVWLYVRHGGKLDGRTAKDVAELADWAAENWREPDSGIWEVQSPPQAFVHSKASLWVALDRAADLAENGVIPDRRDRWGQAAREIRAFVDEQGWDGELGAYVRYPGTQELDAALLTLPILDWAEPGDERIRSTIDAVRDRLAAAVAPLLYRYRGEDGVEGAEGAFLACSFWLADALARTGRLDEAIETMEELIPLANDVGLYSEEIDPETGDFLGNFPQALTHLALINAAVTIANVEAEQ
jgi:GH15 family glucan-1,4-alpha-glucosidase